MLNLEATLRTPHDTRPSEQIVKNHTQKVAPQPHMDIFLNKGNEFVFRADVVRSSLIQPLKGSF